MSLPVIEEMLRSALGHHQAGRRAQAEGLYRQILAVSPDHDGAFHWLGVLALQNNRPDLAVEYLGRACAIQPNTPAYHGNLGNAYMGLGRLDDAAASYRRSLELNPNLAEGHSTLGNALMAQGKVDDAIACYRRALELKPGYAEAHNNLGNALKEQGHLDEAVESYRRAVEWKPAYAVAFGNLGHALQSLGRADEAIGSYRRSLALAPNSAVAHHGLAIALQDLRKLDESEGHFNEALRLRPDYADAHFGRSLLWLLRGDFVRGWAEYEWRWEAQKRFFPRRTFAQPQWDGQPLNGRTIFLHSEQGFGDTLHFVRYVKVVAEYGGKIIVGCQPALKRLLRNSLGAIPVVDYDEALPPFDIQCPLLSLPMVCRTTLDNIPQNVPYVFADAESAKRWRSKIASDSRSRKIGLAWSGRKGQANNHNRSLSLSALAPLGQTPNVRFYSLQKREPGQEAVELPAGLPLVDWTEELHDFADTAGLIANLDLIVSVDTSVAHLAAAMGKPVWTLLSFAGDWRDPLDRDDSPWYPTMRLFRQPELGDWASVIASVGEALRA